MNERILELLAQAGFDVEALREPYPGGFPREDLVCLDAFAKLIVKECAMLVEGFTTAQEVALDECQEYEASEVLKEHFGVK